MKKISKKTVVYCLIGLAILGLGAFAFMSNKQPDTLSLAKVTRENLVQEISVSGTVKAKEAVELAFEKSGRIRNINVTVGQKVGTGEILMSLENGVENSNLEDAKAKLASKQARYDELKKGSRQEEISLKEIELSKEKSDLATIYGEIPNIIGDAFNKTENAVKRQVDNLFTNPSSANPLLNFNSSNQQAVIDAQVARFAVENDLMNLKKIVQEPIVNYENSEKTLIETKKILLTINDFLIKTNIALNSAVSISDATLATNKDALNTARTNINTALTNITDQIQAITAQKITVETAQKQLELTKASATQEVLAGALADIQSADANVSNAKALLSKTYIISPISGIITKQDGKVGQIASSNSVLVTVMSGNFKIEAFVPEVDVAKIAVGNPATITLDAYGNGVIFNAHIVKIDPAETIIDGVSTYKTTFEFDRNDERIRSGMTANTTIVSALRENVLSLPQRAVYEKNGKKFVKIPTSKNSSQPFVEKEVTIGIRGSNGNIEIVSGLELDDEVLSSSASIK